MYRIVENGVELEKYYTTELEAYMVMSRMADKANVSRRPMQVSFPERIELFGADGKLSQIFRIVNMHSVERTPNEHVTSSSMTVQELLRFFDFGPGRTLIKKSKPTWEMRPSLWLPTTDEGSIAYHKLIDVLESVGKIAGFADTMDEIVRKIDEAVEEEVPVEESMNDDCWDMLEDAPSLQLLQKIEKDIADSEIDGKAKNELLRFAEELKERFAE